MRKPFMLSPSAKDYLWGGSRLNDEFAKGIDMSPLAETWECSTHPDGPSFVVSGEYEGKSLTEVLHAHPEFLGTHPAEVHELCRKGELPILIKFIDAKQDLSVQVHPTDEYARKHENGQLGKTEMWDVLDAAKDTSLIYGLKQSVEKDVLRKALEEGKVSRYLQRVPVKKDEVFFIQSGTIHAIGAGALIAEIQENSNLTYRLYDYDRMDKNGQKRSLHIKKALEAADLEAAKEPRQPLRVLHYKPGMASELLCRCKYFEVYRLLVNNERRQNVTYQSDHMSFRVLLCVNGCGTIRFGGEVLEIYKGNCVFVPAESEVLRLHGQMQLLDVRG